MGVVGTNISDDQRLCVVRSCQAAPPLFLARRRIERSAVVRRRVVAAFVHVCHDVTHVNFIPYSKVSTKNQHMLEHINEDLENKNIGEIRLQLGMA